MSLIGYDSPPGDPDESHVFQNRAAGPNSRRGLRAGRSRQPTGTRQYEEGLTLTSSNYEPD